MLETGPSVLLFLVGGVEPLIGHWQGAKPSLVIIVAFEVRRILFSVLWRLVFIAILGCDDLAMSFNIVTALAIVAVLGWIHAIYHIVRISVVHACRWRILVERAIVESFRIMQALHVLCLIVRVGLRLLLPDGHTSYRRHSPAFFIFNLLTGRPRRRD